jgi:hypothetical protein
MLKFSLLLTMFVIINSKYNINDVLTFFKPDLNLKFTKTTNESNNSQSGNEDYISLGLVDKIYYTPSLDEVYGTLTMWINYVVSVGGVETKGVAIAYFSYVKYLT